MSKIVQCDKCGNIMYGSQDRNETTIYKCPICGYNYLTGLRFNRLTEEHVKYVRVL